MRPRLIDRIYKPLLDPLRVQRVFREFDAARGFGPYGSVCRSRFRRHDAARRETALRKQGFEQLPVLSPQRANELLRQFSADDPRAVKEGRRQASRLSSGRCRPARAA